MKNVIVLHWHANDYDSLSALLTLAERELDPAQYRAVTVPVGVAGSSRTLEAAIKAGDCAFALTMSGVGAELTTTTGANFWEAVKVPVFTWHGDHPAYFAARHVIRSPFVIQGYVFPDHARFNRDHLNPTGVAFSVHYGIPSRPGFCGHPPPASQRNGRILFAKTGGDPALLERRWRATLAREFTALLFAATEELRGKNTAAFAGTLARLAAAQGIHLAANSQAMMLLIREADSYLRARRSTLLAESIKPYPVDVVGTGWQHIDWTGAGAIHGGTVDFHALARRLPPYLGSLSINPLTDGSVHERVFCALSAGIVPVSDANAFARAEMPLLAPYSYAVEKHAIQAAIEAVLADPTRALEATEATYQSMLPSYSMRQSMRRIAAFCALRPLNAAL